jgi:ligand-binding SRPBCC domain-containing protein
MNKQRINYEKFLDVPPAPYKEKVWYHRQTYRKAQGRLTTLWDRYEEKTLSTSEFLGEVGNLLVRDSSVV